MSFFRRLFSKNKKKEKEKDSENKDNPGPKKRGSLSGDPKSTEPTKDKRIVRIEKISAPKTIPKGETLKVQVSGHFPDLGWSLKEAFAKVEGDTITITIVGKRKKGMAGQALKPYSTIIEVTGLEKGDYVIKDTRAAARSQRVTVK
ncbi:MAG: hypothetical protein GF308_16530 [Candidatus Heimdallarchaeota archaeon]|nr:hypothetical protein [Candidatus Heimdallarchaeota archaeon]